MRRALIAPLIGLAVAVCSEPVAPPATAALRRLTSSAAVVTPSGVTYTAIALGGLGGTDGLGIVVNAAGQVAGISNGPANQWFRSFFWQNGSFTDLGAFGGLHSYTFDMNASGVVVGWATTDPVGDPAHAFRWENGVLSDLGTLPGFTGSSATAINDRGQIAGESMRSNTNPSKVAFLWENGVMTPLPALGTSTSSATAINSSGVIAGQSRLGLLGPDRAVIWRNGAIVDLGAFGGSFSGNSSFAIDINDAEQVTGTSELFGPFVYHAFRWENGVMTDLGALDGGISWALAINANGDVCGYSTVSDGSSRAVLWRGTTLTDLGMLPGGISAMAMDVNDVGQVVGTVNFPDNTARAFLWENGIMTDLGTLGGDRSYVQFRRSLSNLGHIVGQATTADGVMHPVLWQPNAVLAVTIDVKPGSATNPVNPRSNGVIPVAILSSPTFNAATVDASSVRFGPGAAAESHGRGHIEDVNGDGRPDMLLHFDTRASGITCATTSVTLTGRTALPAGRQIMGTDAVVTTGCR
jgi:probable HAF family extracellular repeat protein